MRRAALPLALLTAVSACAHRAPTAPSAASPAVHPKLFATAWTQSSVEQDALSAQAFAAAAAHLDAALADDGWTAALEQPPQTERIKPPAIVLDIDETVLDNSPYTVRNIQQAEGFVADTWNAWCNEARADAIPGAVAFTQLAASKGATVFYVSNRPSEVEEATRKNLIAKGFPMADSIDTVLLRGERPEWAASDKTPRREAVAADFRIVMLFGDDLGDFLSVEGGDPAARTAALEDYANWWGTRWFVLPNPMYGSWERMHYGGDRSLTPMQKHERILDALED